MSKQETYISLSAFSQNQINVHVGSKVCCGIRQSGIPQAVVSNCSGECERVI